MVNKMQLTKKFSLKIKIHFGVGLINKYGIIKYSSQYWPYLLIPQKEIWR